MEVLDAGVAALPWETYTLDRRSPAAASMPPVGDGIATLAN
jgi:hypothetical protein